MYDLFNIKKISKKMTDKVFKMFKIEDDDLFSPKFKKFLRWVGERLPVILHKILMAITMFFFFKYIYNKFGIDYIILLGVIIMIFNLNKINESLEKLTGE